MEIGKRIENLRKNNKISQSDFAKMLGKSQSGIPAMEKENKQITFQDIIKMCEIFNVSADYVIFGQQNYDKLGLSSEGEKLLNEYIDYLKEKYPHKEYEEVGNL